MVDGREYLSSVSAEIKMQLPYKQQLDLYWQKKIVFPSGPTVSIVKICVRPVEVSDQSDARTLRKCLTGNEEIL